jgi:hypothetical protein
VRPPTPDNVSLWIVSFRRLAALRRTIGDWLASYPFQTVDIVANDPFIDYGQIFEAFPGAGIKIWRNVFEADHPGSIAWSWNVCMRNTFAERDWCLMSQDDVRVSPGWDKLIDDHHVSYVAPVGDVIQLQSLAGFNAVGWYDERFRAIGGPEADYALRMMQTYPDKLSIHDEHVWQWRHNDVGLAEYWHSAPKIGEVAATRAQFNVPLSGPECFARWEQKWGVHVDVLMTKPDEAVRRPGWEEIDWYPAFTRRLAEMGRR